MKAELFDLLVADRTAKRAVAVVTRLEDGVQALVRDDGVEGDLALTAEQLGEARQRLRNDRGHGGAAMPAEWPFERGRSAVAYDVVRAAQVAQRGACDAQARTEQSAVLLAA